MQMQSKENVEKKQKQRDDKSSQQKRWDKMKNYSILCRANSKEAFQPNIAYFAEQTNMAAA